MTAKVFGQKALTSTDVCARLDSLPSSSVADWWYIKFWIDDWLAWRPGTLCCAKFFARAMTSVTARHVHSRVKMKSSVACDIIRVRNSNQKQNLPDCCTCSRSNPRNKQQTYNSFIPVCWRHVAVILFTSFLLVLTWNEFAQLSYQVNGFNLFQRRLDLSDVQWSVSPNVDSIIQVPNEVEMTKNFEGPKQRQQCSAIIETTISFPH